ncbi:MAG: tRNA (N(6)-L-threonylcarbamoyladenosine(37)-C(2))-methylthiotransferase MtaB [Chloroflexi bacterium]|nr:tRNA (N(6)-L-threonylcarbamoyladenosine(37)-C(2))-methylthiotransferase MtaB [Chloroflexota bacterium]
MESEKCYTIAIGTLGCKVNQAESEAIARHFCAAGCHTVSFEAVADAFVLNTCTVTHVADRKARQLLRRARRRNPSALVAAVGCGAGAVGSLADVALANEQKLEVVPLVLQRLAASPARAPLGVAGAAARARTRATVKVQDGCNHRCTYCIVPMVRGAERSVPARQVLAEVVERVREGCQEAVITGPQLGSYCDQAVGDLRGLIRAILQETALPRLRLSSIEPHNFPPGLVDLWPDTRLCRHFHIALQSGSDAVLRRMGRTYRVDQYTELVASIRQRVPGAAITTDVIAGFPGETEREFAETHELVRSLGFARVHVFPFSARPGTRAASLRPLVPEALKRERCEALQRAGREGASGFCREMVGQTLEVLYEEQLADGCWSGYTDNYARVLTPGEAPLANRLLPTHLTGVVGQDLTGRLTIEDHSLSGRVSAITLAS